ncbi:hypothetical protein PJI16_04670 [Nitrospira sp. MA-1]|nr:hypothetical protein [Nitrospira sp. MA-1]
MDQKVFPDPSRPTRRVRVFISYPHKNQDPYLERMKVCLKILKRSFSPRVRARPAIVSRRALGGENPPTIRTGRSGLFVDWSGFHRLGLLFLQGNGKGAFQGKNPSGENRRMKFRLALFGAKIWSALASEFCMKNFFLSIDISKHNPRPSRY